MLKPIRQILKERDEMSDEDINALFNETREMFNEYMGQGDTFSAEDICAEQFGLEPDYLFDKELNLI